jgi:uncharacterized protein YceK
MKGRALAEFCLVLAAATLAGAGCASISARTGKYEPYVYPTVYPGPKTIIYGMQHKQGVAHNILVWPCGIIDFPLSAALDTVLLPFDWPYSASQRSATEEGEPR